MLSNDVGLSHESAQPVMNSDGPQEKKRRKRERRWRKRRKRRMEEKGGMVKERKVRGERGKEAGVDEERKKGKMRERCWKNLG